MSRELRERGVAHGDAEDEFERLRDSFEASEGVIVKAWWGANIALGIALTVKRPRRIDKFVGNLDSEATSRLHRATERLALPAEVERLFEGDLLAAKVSGVLHGGAGRLALERVMALRPTC